MAIEQQSLSIFQVPSPKEGNGWSSSSFTAGAVSDNPFHAMPYVPARGTHVTNKENNNEKQTIHY
ncbi:hypothetical protein [Akkermansia muciniphila]|uniref:hypothetical protein n=1 Tax=Akkermansia muciniphila TaxID=239935 RepID=UPI00122F1999|nr:hypothetical protein [Akkermansia muciniphila]KAA4257676.1 hypothetical protein F3D15_13955 [Bacteroides ovatus]MZX01927.1 hypothetical protein [Escherichia coli]KAA3333339.1 hypothetical protein F1930_07495 [Akkermansia muciniphila]KAA3349306.1 hypothetical protein F1899_06395 [Akkermansia muciniphila]KAA3352751.1 hypothetical protein F1910_07475 [Akkermansia muciniphila]